MVGGVDRRNLVAALAALPLLPGAALAQVKAPAQRVSVAIGLNAYQWLDPLKRAEADALAINRRLKTIGYETLQALNPTRAQLDATIGDFVERIGPDTSAIFYYAGHGFEAGGANYLTVRDTSPTRDQLFTSSVGLSDVLARIAARRPKQAIIVLDACREASWLKGADRDRQGFTSVVAPNGFYIVYSAGSGEFALDHLGDGDRDPNSVFTRAFIKYIEPDLCVDEVVKAARVEVTRAAAAIGHPQHPSTYDQTSQTRSLRGDVVARRGEASAGDLPRTLALLIGVEDAYGLRLIAPSADVQLVARALSSMGAEVRTLFNPDLAGVRELLREAAASDAEHIMVYWTGLGGCLGPSGREDTIFLTRFQCVESRVLEDQTMTLSEMLGILRSEQRRVTVFGDVCLDRVDAPGQTGPGDPASRGGTVVNTFAGLQRATLEDSESDGGLGDAAVMFATGLERATLDVVDGRTHGAFALGLANALARPGVSLRDATRVVRREVETMTDRMQAPFVVGTRGALSAPLVQLALNERGQPRPFDGRALRPGAGLNDCRVRPMR